MKQVIFQKTVIKNFNYELTASARSACYLFHDNLLIGLFFYHEDGGDMFLRNVM
jgi:hypothetical protein